MKLTKFLVVFGSMTVCVLVALVSMLSYTNWPFTNANNNFFVAFGIIMGCFSSLPVLLTIKISQKKLLKTIILLIVSAVFEYLFITIAFVV